MSIEVKDLCFSYGEREVLHGVSFKAEQGEFLSILGPNGVGKSTLFRCVLGLLRDYTGSITVEGRDAKSLSIREAAKLVAYIPQSSHPAFNYSVRDIVLMGTTSGLGTFSTPKKEDVRRVEEALEKIGISHLAERCFHRISGGERQLALIARALVQRAPVLMLDEPSLGLAPIVVREIFDIIRTVNQQGITVLLNEQNANMALKVADYAYVLETGTLTLSGTGAELLTNEQVKAAYLGKKRADRT